MADQEIYVSPEAAGAGAPVIRVGGDCYEYVEPSDQEPTVAMIDGEFADCDACVPAPCTCPDPDTLATSYLLNDPPPGTVFTGAGSAGSPTFDYRNGIVTSPIYGGGLDPGGLPLWDGTYYVVAYCPPIWAGNHGSGGGSIGASAHWNGNRVEITGDNHLYLGDSEGAPVGEFGGLSPCAWYLTLVLEDNDEPQHLFLWIGKKTTGETPVGVYTAFKDSVTGTILQVPTTFTVS